jgi:hypothetical protein
VVGTVHPADRNVAATEAARPEVRVELSTTTGIEVSTALVCDPVVAEVGELGLDPAVGELPVVGAVGTDAPPWSAPTSTEPPLLSMLEAVDLVNAQAPSPTSTTTTRTAIVDVRSRRGERRGR